MEIFYFIFVVGLVRSADIFVHKDIVFKPSKLSYGANTPSYLNHKHMAATGASMVAATGVGSIRWPGGNWANTIIWNNDFSVCDYFKQFANNNADWTFNHLNAATLAKEQGIDVLYQMNAALGFVCGADYAAKVAADFVANLTAQGFPVKYIEVGNENYGAWEVPYKDHPELVNGTAYGNICVKMSAAIKAILPSVQVGCVGVFKSGTFPTWMEDVLRVAGPNMDFIIMHAYFSKHFGGSPEPTPYDALNYGCIADPAKQDCNPQIMADNVAKMVKQYAPSRKSILPIMLTEYNMEQPYASETWEVVEGLFTAKTIGESMQGGLIATTFFALANGGGPDYGMFAKTAPLSVAFGPVYAFAMYKYVAPVGSSLLKTEVDTATNVTAFGFLRDDDRWGLIIINLAAEPLTLSFEGPWGSGSVNASIYTFQAATGLDPFHATSFMWNGNDSASKGGPFPFDNISPSRKILAGSIDVAAASLTGIIIDNESQG